MNKKVIKVDQEFFRKVAFTMGNKNSYERALLEDNEVEKIGRSDEYGGGLFSC